MVDDKTNVSRADLSEQFDFLRHERRLRIPTSASTATFSSSGDDSVPNTAQKNAWFLLARRRTRCYYNDGDGELDLDDGFAALMTRSTHILAREDAQRPSGSLQMLRGGDGDGTQFCEHHLHSPSPPPVYVFNQIDNHSICVFLADPTRRDDSPPKAQIIRNMSAILVLLMYQLQCPLSSSTPLEELAVAVGEARTPNTAHFFFIQLPRSSNTKKRVD